MNALNDNVIRVYATGTYSDEDLKQVNVHDNATMVMTFSRGTYAVCVCVCVCIKLRIDGKLSYTNTHTQTQFSMSV